MARGYTLDELLKMGAKPIAPTQQGGLTKQQLQQQGAVFSNDDRDAMVNFYKAPQPKKGFLERITSPLFPYSPSDSPLKAGFKTLGNVPTSAAGFGVGVAKFLTPTPSKLRDIAEVFGDQPFGPSKAIRDVNQELQAQTESEVGLSQMNQKLIEAIRQNRAQGKDNTKLINQLKANGATLPPDLRGELGMGQLAGKMATGLIPGEVPKHLATALVAFAKGNKNLEGDKALQKAAEAIVNNPVGEVAPYLLMSQQIAEKMGYGEQFNKAIETIASPVTATEPGSISLARGAIVVGQKAKAFANTLARFGTAQATGLNPKTIKTILENPDEFTTENAAKYTREDIAQKVHDNITARRNELRSTGAGYDEIRNADGEVIVPKNLTAKILDENYGLKFDKQGNLIETAESVPLKAGDVAALEKFYKQYGKETTLSNNGFLNARMALDDLADWDATRSDTSIRIGRDLRAAYDKVGKQQVEGLAELDAQYAPEVKILDKIKNDYLKPDGTFKDNAISKIANLSKTGKEQVLARLEEIRPGIGKEVTILNAVEDIEHAAGQKVGSYARTTLAGGGIVGGLVTGNVPLVVASVVEAILAEPHNAASILRGWAKLRGVADKVSAPIIDTLKNINEFDTEALSQKAKGLVPGLTTKAVGGYPGDQQGLPKETPEEIATSVNQINHDENGIVTHGAYKGAKVADSTGKLRASYAQGRVDDISLRLQRSFGEDVANDFKAQIDVKNTSLDELVGALKKATEGKALPIEPLALETPKVSSTTPQPLKGVTKIPLKQLLDIEGDVLTETSTKIPAGELSKSSGPIDVVKTPDGYIVLDGQHRAVEALANKESFIQSNVLTKEQALAKYGKRWPQLAGVLNGGLDPLIQEAKKYKSAEEFVNKNYGKSFPTWEIRPTIDFTGKSPKTIVFSEGEAKATVEHLQELGFNPSVSIKEESILTKSQLTDIWNKAHKK